MHLTKIGLPELIAKDVDEFVGIAVDLASDIVRLERIRQGLREPMKASPIMDEQRYNRFLEAELRVFGEFGAMVRLRRRRIFRDNRIGKCVVDTVLEFRSVSN